MTLHKLRLKVWQPRRYIVNIMRQTNSSPFMMGLLSVSVLAMPITIINILPPLLRKFEQI